jgi:N-acetylglutamate synthase-like GNAT family acetyltransferase
LVSFRVATLDDFEQCRRFDFSHVPDNWLKQSIQNGWVYLVEEGDTTIGCARLEYIWLSLPYIGLITLEDEFQRKGIGTALIERIAQDLTKQGHRALYTSTEDEGTPEFYQKCGFSQCGTISEINETGNDEIYFIRYLQKG